MLNDLTLEHPAPTRGSPTAAPPPAYLIDGTFVQYMMQRCTSQTAAGLNEQFGISWNTWSKLRKGQPIRRSVALRLVARVLAEQGSAADPMAYLKQSDF